MGLIFVVVGSVATIAGAGIMLAVLVEAARGRLRQ